jgi:methionyl-tRNA synthetase
MTPYSQTDINFDWDAFEDKINNELIAKIGNFINRSLSFAHRSFAGIVPNPGAFDNDDKECIDEIKKIAFTVGELLANNEIDKAVKQVIQFSMFLNQYFQKKQPWINTDTSATTIYVSTNAVRTLAILLEPFIPFSSEKVWAQLNLDGDVHSQNWFTSSELKISPGHKLGKIEPLFKKIEATQIQHQKLKLEQS